MNVYKHYGIILGIATLGFFNTIFASTPGPRYLKRGDIITLSTTDQFLIGIGTYGKGSDSNGLNDYKAGSANQALRLFSRPYQYAPYQQYTAAAVEADSDARMRFQVQGPFGETDGAEVNGRLAGPTILLKSTLYGGFLCAARKDKGLGYSVNTKATISEIMRSSGNDKGDYLFSFSPVNVVAGDNRIPYRAPLRIHGCYGLMTTDYKRYNIQNTEYSGIVTGQYIRTSNTGTIFYIDEGFITTNQRNSSIRTLTNLLYNSKKNGVPGATQLADLAKRAAAAATINSIKEQWNQASAILDDAVVNINNAILIAQHSSDRNAINIAVANASSTKSAAENAYNAAKKNADDYGPALEAAKTAAIKEFPAYLATIQSATDALQGLLQKVPASSGIKKSIIEFAATAKAQLATVAKAEAAAASSSVIEDVADALKNAQVAAGLATEAKTSALALPALIIPDGFDDELGKTESVAIGDSCIYCVSLDGKQLLYYNNDSMAPNPWEPVTLTGMPTVAPKAAAVDAPTLAEPVLIEAVACGGDNFTCLLDANGTVHTVTFSNNTTGSCTPLIAAQKVARVITSIAVGNPKNIWAIDNEKNVLQFDNNDWVVRAEDMGHDIAAGSDGFVAIINTEGDPLFFNNGDWIKLPTLPNDLNLDQIAVLKNNELYGVSEDHRLWHLSGVPAIWTVLKDAAGKDAVGYKNVATNSSGTVFATAVNNEIYTTAVHFRTPVVAAHPVVTATGPMAPKTSTTVPVEATIGVVAPPAGPVIGSMAPVTQGAVGATPIGASVLQKGAIKKIIKGSGRHYAKRNGKLNIKEAKKTAKHSGRKKPSKIKAAKAVGKVEAQVNKTIMKKGGRVPKKAKKSKKTTGKKAVAKPAKKTATKKAAVKK
jgi:hypothetical protein